MTCYISAKNTTYKITLFAITNNVRQEQRKPVWFYCCVYYFLNIGICLLLQAFVETLCMTISMTTYCMWFDYLARTKWGSLSHQTFSNRLFIRFAKKSVFYRVEIEAIKHMCHI